MTNRYLHLATTVGVLRFRLPDLDWLANSADRVEEHDEQMGDCIVLGAALAVLLRGTHGVDLPGVASLHEDGNAVALIVEYGYNDEYGDGLAGIRFVREQGRVDDDVVVEYQLEARSIHFGKARVA